MKKLLIGLSAIFAAALSAPGALAGDTQAWTALFANGPVDSGEGRFLLWFDAHARYSEDVSRLGVSIIRPGVGYRLNDNVSAWAGYAWVVSRADGRESITEHRIWQQATYGVASGPWGSLSGRSRLEQRFVETGADTGHRFRQFLRWSKPVAPRWTAVAWNEAFFAFNDTDWGAASGYDQNRTFIGMGWKPNDAVAIEGGYLLNHLNRAVDQTNHNLSLSLVVPL